MIRIPISDYSEPSRECDLVMKGGITSGVVYPGAVCELAKTFRFVNIGGTSAGAIAAAATAAAELGRTRPGAGFARLAQLPQALGELLPEAGGRSRLFSLFQPQRSTRAVFNTAVAALGGGRLAWVRVGLSAIRSAPWVALAGAIPGGALGWFVAARASSPIEYMLGGAGAVAALLVGALLAALGRLASVAVREVPRNGFGLCTGLSGPETEYPALTVWLDELFDELAGRSRGLEAPLTFGELWGSRDGATRLINLEMMTTCLTLGRPFRLPFRDETDARENVFYFREDEWVNYFPGRILAWLKSHQREPSDPVERVHFNEAGFYALPDPADLPVVVAVRMSLSFPVLLSALPLHRRQLGTGVGSAPPDGSTPPLVRCWFSDGGICSNFPVHFFEAPVPRRPTFAINLHYVPAGGQTGVWLPRTNNEAIEPEWNEIDRRPGAAGLMAFLTTIVGTARNWPDTTQSKMPGYRDRIAHVILDPTEGGLNLNMPPATIAALSSRGREAAAELAARYDPARTPPADVNLTWANHRWVRLRTFLASLRDMLRRFTVSWGHTQRGDPDYTALLATGSPTGSYPMTPAEQETAADVVEQLLAIDAACEAQPNLSAKAPRPPPELKLRPRI